jgi:membrane-associated phospholipid phosphatase
MTHVTFRGTGTTLGDNVGLVAALIAVVVAQVLKPFSAWAITGRFKASLMVGSGGFPSSHSSLVTALATGTACQAGLGDPAFATALVLALVVRPHLVNTHFYSVPAVASLFAPRPFTRAKTLTSARSTAIL